jgi:hypothetical protein|tara:strand:+ start:358 stop:561 length:204 start_codon:yes stop_codon:yes gene_type:complete
MTKKKIKHNDLLPWFTQDHGTLPQAYLASCEKFFKSLKQQAASSKRQATSLTDHESRTIKDLERNKL